MFTLVVFIVLLLTLIFVHELGHFLAAKALGVKVERFSLGFPPKMISTTIGETEYQLAWIPLGGYVKLLGENPYEEGQELSEADKKRSFSGKPPWAKAIIVIAGPLFNLLFAFLILWFLALTMGDSYISPKVGRITPDGPAFNSSLMVNDVILGIDGKKIQHFGQIATIVNEVKNTRPLKIEVQRGNEVLNFDLMAKRNDSKNIFGETQENYILGIMSYMPPVVSKVIRKTPAKKVGFMKGDIILEVNGQKITDWVDVSLAIQPWYYDEKPPKTLPPLKPLVFKISRNNKISEITVTPKPFIYQDYTGDSFYGHEIGLLGELDLIKEKIGLFKAAKSGFKQTTEMTKTMVLGLGKLIRGKVSFKTMGGPFLIADVAGQSAAQGFSAILFLAAFISLNLGIINLVPLPVLDGGQLVFFTIEGITRRPLSVKIREKAQLVGMVLLATLMIAVIGNDLLRISKNITLPKPEQVSSPIIEIEEEPALNTNDNESLEPLEPLEAN